MIRASEAVYKVHQQILSQPIDIPVFHEVALRLQQMMNDHSYRVDEAIKLVNEDTALAAEMLKQANSTYNSGTAAITTIKNAIVRLGSQQVVNLAFTASMANSKSDNPVINTHLTDLWHHCHVVAITSACLAIQVKNDYDSIDIDADEAYLSGLLHAIGKLYLLKSMDELNKEGTLHTDCIIDDIINEHNTEQGIKVMRHFNIPEIYINSVERHNSVTWKTGINDYLVAAVRLSCKVHNYIKQGVVLNEDSEAYLRIEDELLLLDIDDANHLYNMVKAISC